MQNFITRWQSCNSHLIFCRFLDQKVTPKKKGVCICILPLKELCEELDIEYYSSQPKELINSTVMKLSEDKEVTTIFMCDEIWPCYDEGQTTPDWSNIRVEDNIVWVLSVRPSSASDETSSMLPPAQSSKILTIKLVHGHRNCKEIRSVGITSFPPSLCCTNTVLYCTILYCNVP